tara:strand:- start:335 stop:484 length:150 start_codon:yes stop_codon:yes gene_type:complete
MKDINDIHVAEKPKPLNPLIIDAMNTIKTINKNSDKLKLRSDNRLILFF